MIELSCTNCQKVLQIDDAFAGGVCRCRHCGTIQTVPAKQKRAPSPNAKMVPMTKAAPPAPSKTMYQKPTHAEASPNPSSGTGLEDLAQVVASSGLGTGLSSSRLTKAPAIDPPIAGDTTPAPTITINQRKLILYGGAGAALLIIALLVALLMRGGSNEQTASNNKLPTPVKPTPEDTGSNNTVTTGPNFAGLPLKAPLVYLLLDRGSGTQETFDYIKAAAAKSLQTLDPGTKFRVVFWQTDNIFSTPKDEARYATAENVKASIDEMAEVFAFGQSKVQPAMDLFTAAKDMDIVLCTGKYGLDEDFVQSVIRHRKSNRVHIHTVAMGSAASLGPTLNSLKKIAASCDGQFIQVTGQDLAKLLR